MMNNWAIVEKTFALLAEKGIKDIVLCPGGRNAPFVSYLKKNHDLFNLYSFVDERSASFYALGISKAKAKPVAIFTTSGTAVSELYSAMVESYYSGNSLVVVSADRPKRYRGTGAPQSIDQAFMFKHYVNMAIDAETPTELEAFEAWTNIGNVHLNLCFDEPLIPTEVPNIKLEFKEFVTEALYLNEHGKRSMNYLELLDQPLVMIGALTQSQSDSLAPFLNQLQFPILFESSSHLGHRTELNNLTLPSEQVARKLLKENKIKSILRIGHVPSFKLWRELETVFGHIPVYSFSSLPFAGLTRGEIISTNLVDLISYLEENKFNENKGQFKVNYFEYVDELKKNLFIKYPLSEQALIHNLSQKIGENVQIYLGNSLPIREWNQFAVKKDQIYFENRGANGIDGQISTWFGVMKGSAHRESWMIVGDLTTLYDMNAFWADKFHGETSWRLVVVNNSGGKIFERMYNNDLFENNHQLNFENLAKFWSVDYKSWSQIPETINLPSKVIIEMKPDNDQSKSFFEEWKGHA